MNISSFKTIKTTKPPIVAVQMTLILYVHRRDSWSSNSSSLPQFMMTNIRLPILTALWNPQRTMLPIRITPSNILLINSNICSNSLPISQWPHLLMKYQSSSHLSKNNSNNLGQQLLLTRLSPVGIFSIPKMSILIILNLNFTLTIIMVHQRIHHNNRK